MREEEPVTEQTREENPTERSSWLVWLNYLFCSLHSAIIPHLVCVLSELVDSAVVLYYPHWRKIEDGGEGYIFLLQYLFPGIHPSLTQSWTPIAHRPTGSTYFAWEKTRIHAQMTHPWAGGNRRSHRQRMKREILQQFCRIVPQFVRFQLQLDWFSLPSAQLVLLELSIVRNLRLGWIEQNKWIL